MGALLFGCVTPATTMTEQVERGLLSAGTRSGELTLLCKPPDAEVFIDEMSVGACTQYEGKPKGLTLSKGLRQVVVKKVGFLPYQSYVDSDGTQAALTIELVPTLRVGSTP